MIVRLYFKLVVNIMTYLFILNATIAFSEIPNQQNMQKEIVDQKLSLNKKVQPLDMFWNKFRKAVLDKNYKTIESMTKFPFRSTDYFGDGPTFSYNIKEFPFAFNVLINHSIIAYNSKYTTYELIRISKKPPKLNKKLNTFNFGILQFNKLADKWFLVGANISGFDDYPDLISTGPIGTPQQSIQEFWDIFRRAVMKNDYAAIVSMTSFPFFTHGPSDDYPAVKHKNKREFIKTIDSMLITNIDPGDFKESMRSFIMRNKTVSEAIAPENITDHVKYCSIKKFTFWKFNGKWFFTSAVHPVNPTLQNKGY